MSEHINTVFFAATVTCLNILLQYLYSNRDVSEHINTVFVQHRDVSEHINTVFVHRNVSEQINTVFVQQQERV